MDHSFDYSAPGEAYGLRFPRRPSVLRQYYIDNTIPFTPLVELRPVPPVIYMERLIWLLFFGLVLSLKAMGLTLLTEVDPPYNFAGKDGVPCGYAVDVVSEIQKRIGRNDKIQIVPWARAYRMIQNEPDVVVFTMARTKPREDLFQWVGPIVENGWVFIGKKGSGLNISSLQDAMKLRAVGVVRDYAWDKYLMDSGFENLEKVSGHAQNIKKLAYGRIQAFVSSDLGYQWEIAEAGMDPGAFEVLFKFKVIQLYIAHSKGTDKAVVDHWQSALGAMISDGTLSALLQKWIPLAGMPGPAKAAD